MQGGNCRTRVFMRQGLRGWTALSIASSVVSFAAILAVSVRSTN